MKRFTLITLVCLIASESFTQSSKLLINSGELIKEGIELHNEKKYKEAIALYNQVPENDTNFAFAIYELTLSARLDSQFNVGIQAAKKCLAQNSNYEHDLLLQLGSLYNDVKKYDSAVQYINTSISKFPNSYATYHGKAIHFYHTKKYDSAFLYFKKAILMNPYAYNSHYCLGLMAMENGYPIQAMLAFSASLLISPSGGRSSASIKNLYELANLSDSVLNYYEKREEHKYLQEDYAEIESYFKSKIALEKNYKIKASINDNIFKQLNLICEKLPKVENETGTWFHDFYASLFKNIYEENHFNGATLIMISGLKNEDVQRMIKQSKSEIEKASIYIAERLNEFGYARSTTRPVNYDLAGYHFNNQMLFAYGKLNNRKKEIQDGNWVYYNKTGNIISERNYQRGQLDGIYKEYYNNGKLRFEGDFKNNEIHGRSFSYYKNGLPSVHLHLKGEKRDGPCTKFNFNGSKKLEENYEDGKINGPTTSYFERGNPQYTGEYINGKITGRILQYYRTNQLLSSTEIVNGEANGTKTTYYPQGQLFSTSEMKNGKIEGLVTTFFKNGKVAAKENFKKDKLDGNSIFYFENGVEKLNINYSDGEKEGTSVAKTDDNKISSIIEYRKGHYKKIKKYNVLNDQLLVENNIDDKETNTIREYNGIGILISESICDRDGAYNGLCKIVYPDGKIRETKTYKKGFLQGEIKKYFKNGKLSEEANFKDDKYDGVYKSYHDNGKLKMEGTFVEGVKQGYWLNYDNYGALIEKEYYLDDEFDGNAYYYFPSGKLRAITKFDNGNEIQTSEYDTNTVLIQKIDIEPNKPCKLLFKYLGNKKLRECTILNNSLQGDDINYYINGNISSKSHYTVGYLDSNFTSYYSNGKVKKEGNYVNNEMEGTWTSYDKMGNKLSIEHYNNGELDGIDTFYSEENKLETIIPHSENDRHGWLEKYAYNGDLCYKLHYFYGFIIGYSYQLPDGTFAKEIPVSNSDKKELIKTFYKNGTVSAEFEYQNADYHGTRKLFFPNGKVWVESNYLFGERDGNDKVYFSNGQIAIDRTFINGEVEGLSKTYYTNGKLQEEINYKNGYLHGKSNYYKQDGTLEISLNYYWGYILPQ